MVRGVVVLRCAALCFGSARVGVVFGVVGVVMGPEWRSDGRTDVGWLGRVPATAMGTVSAAVLVGVVVGWAPSAVPCSTWAVSSGGGGGHVQRVGASHTLPGQ